MHAPQFREPALSHPLNNLVRSGLFQVLGLLVSLGPQRPSMHRYRSTRKNSPFSRHFLKVVVHFSVIRILGRGALRLSLRGLLTNTSVVARASTLAAFVRLFFGGSSKSSLTALMLSQGQALTHPTQTSTLKFNHFSDSKKY